jgi:hypothetical protein
MTRSAYFFAGDATGGTDNEPRPGVPFMITQAQRQRLREIGHDEEAIQNMTPEAAHKLLGTSAPRF